LNQIQADSKVNPHSLARRVFKEISDDLSDTATRLKMRALRDLSAEITHEEVTFMQRQFLEQVYVLAGATGRRGFASGGQDKSIAPRRDATGSRVP